jgi:hypothetical protein
MEDKMMIEALTTNFYQTALPSFYPPLTILSKYMREMKRLVSINGQRPLLSRGRRHGRRFFFCAGF